MALLLLYSFPHSNRALVANYKARIFAFSFSYALPPFYQLYYTSSINCYEKQPQTSGTSCNVGSFPAQVTIQCKCSGKERRKSIPHTPSGYLFHSPQTQSFFEFWASDAQKTRQNLGDLFKTNCRRQACTWCTQFSLARTQSHDPAKSIWVMC